MHNIILPQALNARAEYLAQQWLAQHQRGIVLAIAGDGYIDLRETMIEGLPPQPFGCDVEVDAAVLLAVPEADRAPLGRCALALLVRCASARELLDVAALLDPREPASVHMDGGDSALAASLMPQLERLLRRPAINSFTG